MDRKALGKTIGDVFQKTAKSRESNQGFLEVDIGLIRPPGNNPRKVFEDEELEELSESIKQHGILQPIVVIRQAGGYEIVSGERRYRASKIANVSTVPIVIREYTNDQDIAELRLIENIQRQDLGPVELAQAYQELLNEHDLTQEELGKRVGKSRTSITNSIRLLTLNKEVLLELISGTISTGHAKVLLGCPNAVEQKKLCKECVEKSLSIRDLEKLMKKSTTEQLNDHIDTSSKEKKSKKEIPPKIRELQDNLSRLFGTKVQVNEKNGKGAITLHFDTREAFQDLYKGLDKLMSNVKEEARSVEE